MPVIGYSPCSVSNGRKLQYAAKLFRFISNNTEGLFSKNPKLNLKNKFAVLQQICTASCNVQTNH